MCDLPTTGINADIWQEHRTNIDTLMGHEAFAALTNETPLDLAPDAKMDKEDGVGFCQPFDETKALNSLSATGKYLAAINIAWLDWRYTPVENIPIAWSTVKGLQKHYFSSASGHGFADNLIEVPILKDQLSPYAFTKKGSWPYTSPTEMIMAFVAGAASAVTADAADALDWWRYQALTAPCLFVVVDSEADIEWRAHQIREDAAQNSSLARTPIQRIFDINNRRFKLGTNVTAQQIVDIYSEKLQMSDRSESITKGWVVSAFAIWDRALSKPEIQKVILKEEADYQQDSMFRDTQKLLTIVQKAVNSDDIEWAFKLLHDYHNNDLLTSSDCSLREVQGKRPADNGKGLIDFLICKRRVMQYFVDNVTTRYGMPDEIRIIIRDMFNDPTKFRAAVGKSEDAAWPLVAASASVICTKCFLQFLWEGALATSAQNESNSAMKQS